MLDPKLKHVMPHDYCASWIKPLHRGRDVNKAKNYRIIMADSLIIYTLI